MTKIPQIRNLKAEYSQLCAKFGKDATDEIYRGLAHAILQLIGEPPSQPNFSPLILDWET